MVAARRDSGTRHRLLSVDGVLGACGGRTRPGSSLMVALPPPIAAGCSIILKPSPLTPVTALMLAEVCTAAGVPPGVINVVTGTGHEIGAALVAHKYVDKIAFTGSTEIGLKVMAACAEHLKPILLELGGKSPNIILEDANLDGAVPGSLFGTFFHGGQVCESGTRILVQRSIYTEFVEKFAEGAKAIVVGDPMDFNTTMGPLISQAQLDRVEHYVALGKQNGARLVFGGHRREIEGGGYYPLPTIFADADNDMTVAREEVICSVAELKGSPTSAKPSAAGTQ
jgi:acyl-CoA reductase-like NAD-dependent aldehyde dehydrogenase